MTEVMTETMVATKPETVVATTGREYTVNITSKGYATKPTPNESAGIQRGISASRLTASKELIGQYLVNGFSVTTGVLEHVPGVSNTNKNAQYNEVLMIDFDNIKVSDENEKNGLYPDPELLNKVLDTPWIKQNVAFIYKSFSYTPEIPKFRAVVFLTKQLDSDLVTSTYEHIYDQLEAEGIDRRCIDVGAKNPSRLFHGSQAKTYIEVNMDSEWEPKQKERAATASRPKNEAIATGTDPIEYNEGLAIMEAFVEGDYARLVDDDNAQNNWLSAMFTLYGNFIDGQITEDQALEYAEVLAAGNGEWADNNNKRMQKMIDGQEDKREVFSFRDKFQKAVYFSDPDSDIAKDYKKRSSAAYRKAKGTETKSYEHNTQTSPFETSSVSNSKKSDTVRVEDNVLDYDEGLDIMKAYAENKRVMLLNGDISTEYIDGLDATKYMVVALNTLYANFIDGQITKDQALGYAKVLAAGDQKLGRTNVQYMEKMIQDKENKLAYLLSFRDKFQKTVTENKSFEALPADEEENLNDGQTKELFDFGYVIRDSKGEIVEVITKYKMGDKVKNYGELADIVVEYSNANYTQKRMYVKPRNNPFWTDSENILHRTIASTVGRMTSKLNNEIVYQMGMTASNYGLVSDAIQLRNGHHLYDGEIKEGWTKAFTPFYVNVDYNPDAYSKEVDEFLEFVVDGDKDLRIFLEELIGHALLRSGKDGRLFFLTDTTQKGGTGKSTFGTMFTNFLEGTSKTKDQLQSEIEGSTDFKPTLMPTNIEKPYMTSHVNIKNFTDDTTVLTMATALANFGDESSMTTIKDTEMLKSMATGGAIEARGVYDRKLTRVIPTLTSMFATNEMPKFLDNSGGMARRLCPIPFNRRPSEAGIEPDLRLDEKLATVDAQSYLLNLGLKGIQSMKANNRKMHIPEVVRQLNEKHLKNSDTVAQFLEDWMNMSEIELRKFGELTKMDSRDAYVRFVEWSEESGYLTRSRNTFETRMNALGYELVRSTTDMVTVKGQMGRPKVFKKAGSDNGKGDVFANFMDSHKIEGRYWSDVYDDYVKVSESEHVKPMNRKQFSNMVFDRGYEKRKSPKLFTNAEGAEGRHMIFGQIASNYGNPFEKSKM